MIKSWIGGSEFEEKNRVSSFRGYLYKLRRSPNLLAPQWGRRWFSIEGHFLRWYRYETDLCAAGMVDLKYVKNIIKSESLGPTAFTVDCEERSLVLKCTSISEMNNWIRALHKQADIARGGTGTNLVSDFNQVNIDSSNIKYSRKPGQYQSKSKMSRLEQELEETLKKLEELEHRVDLEDSVGKPLQKRSNSDLDRERERFRRSEEDQMEKVDAEDALEDSLSSYEVPIRYGRNVHSPARDSANLQHSTHPHTPPPRTGRAEQINSWSSIEDISLSASKVRKQRDQANRTVCRRLDLDDRSPLLADTPPRHRDIIAGLTHGQDTHEDFIIEEYPEEDSARRPAGSKSKTTSTVSTSSDSRKAAKLNRRQNLDSDDDNHAHRPHRNLNGVHKSRSNSSSHQRSDDEKDYSEDRRPGSGTLQQWQHQQQYSSSSVQRNGSAARRASNRHDEDDEDHSDLIQVRTSRDRLPGKLAPRSTSSNSSSSQNNNKRSGNYADVTESEEFTEEGADYGAPAYYGRHGRDPGRSKSGQQGSKSHQQSSAPGFSGYSMSHNNGGINGRGTGTKQFANLKSAWVDS
jgi:hypothetical protein